MIDSAIVFVILTSLVKLRIQINDMASKRPAEASICIKSDQFGDMIPTKRVAVQILTMPTYGPFS
jgi:hypothetical protein